MPGAVLRGAVGAAVVAAAALAPRAARADVALQLVLAPGVTWTRSTPALTSQSVTTDSRSFAENKIAARGSLTSLGGYVDSQIVFSDRMTVPFFGYGLYRAVGSYDGIVTADDGSIARLRPWTATRHDILLPGLGMRAKHRRWMYEASLRPAWTVLGMQGDVATGTDSRRIDPSGSSFLLLAQVSVCRRLDPVQRVCVEVAPRIYDFGFLNGGTLGLRYEWGL